MSDTPDLTVVAAVYNNASFLTQFFTCLKQQRLSNWELIVVNDGSSDNSGEILRQHAEQFPNMKIITQENQGVSVARDTGLAHARGRYIVMPDTDDIILPGMYNRLLSAAQENDLDVAVCNGRYVYEDGRPSRPIFPLQRLRSSGVLTGPEWLQRGLSSRKFLHVVWLNIYRREFLAAHGFRFEPGLSHQDIPWVTEVLLNARRVQYIDEIYYEYFLHSGSVSWRNDDDAARVKKVRTYMKILDMLAEINQRYPHLVSQAPACYWQIGKEGLGIVLTLLAIKSPATRREMAQEFFSRDKWRQTWRHAHDFRLRWRLLRRYFRLKAALKA